MVVAVACPRCGGAPIGKLTPENIAYCFRCGWREGGRVMSDVLKWQRTRELQARATIKEYNEALEDGRTDLAECIRRANPDIITVGPGEEMEAK